MKKSGLSVFVPRLLSAILFLFVIGLQNMNITYGSPYTNTNVDTAYNMITNGSYHNLVVLDVRRQDEYDSGHIHGAVLIPHTELDERIEELAGYENSANKARANERVYDRARAIRAYTRSQVRARQVINALIASPNKPEDLDARAHTGEVRGG